MPSKLQQSHRKRDSENHENQSDFYFAFYRAAQIFEILGLNKTLLNISLTPSQLKALD
jgi:hypothetical protein